MSQKINKIIVLIAFILTLFFIASMIASKYGFKFSFKPTGQIYGTISGQSYDAKVPDDIGLENVSVLLTDMANSKIIFRTASQQDGSYNLSHLPLEKNYFIEIDQTQEPASYYLPYKTSIRLSSKHKSAPVYIKLFLNDRALRDLQRQQTFYLYGSVLLSYHQKFGYYPQNPQTDKLEEIKNLNNKIIQGLIPFVKEIKFDPKNLLDPIADKPVLYFSDGAEYKLKVYPEIITKISLYDFHEGCYLIHSQF